MGEESAESPSIAERWARTLRFDRLRHLEELTTLLREQGNAEGLAQVEEGLALIGGASADPVEEAYQGTRELLIDAMADLGFDRGTLNGIEVCGVAQAELSASAQGYEDGSALVRISDTLLSLAELYASHVARYLVRDSLLDSIRASFRRHVSGDFGLGSDLLAVSLRYDAVHQRVFRLSAVQPLLLSERRRIDADWITQHSLAFAMAHEFAHHVLGHTDAARRAGGGGSGASSCTAGRQGESDADGLALRTVLRLRERNDLGHLGHAALGAAIAIVAVRYVEQSAFVRRGISHPPAQTRLDALVAGLPFRIREFVRLHTRGVLAATDAGSVFGPGAPELPWSYIVEHPEIMRPAFGPEYQDRIVRCDAVQTAEPGVLVDFLTAWDRRHGTGIAEGAAVALEGRPGAALAAWGVPADSVARMLDPAAPLSFHALLSEIQAALPASGAGVDEHRILALHAATLVQEPLRKEPTG